MRGEDDAYKSFNFNLNFNHHEAGDHVGVSEECRGHSASGADECSDDVAASVLTFDSVVSNQ